jgi:hypothetical protein
VRSFLIRIGAITSSIQDFSAGDIPGGGEEGPVKDFWTGNTLSLTGFSRWTFFAHMEGNTGDPPLTRLIFFDPSDHDAVDQRDLRASHPGKKK